MKIKKIIVLKYSKPVADEELKIYCEEKLGRYKIPKRFIFLQELPKTQVGKIDKKKLRDMNTKS